MDLQTLFVFLILALLYAALVPGRWRPWVLLGVSVPAIYWMQPWLPLRYADFLLPTATVGLTVAGWWVTRPQPQGGWRSLTRTDRAALALILGMVALMGLNRFLAPEWRLTPSRPPAPWLWGGLLVGFALLLGLGTLALRRQGQRLVLLAGVVLLLGIFLGLKAPGLTTALARVWRHWTGQHPELASANDLRWLGFSYVSFRLIHTLRDRQTGLLPSMGLGEYVTYVLFFPAFIAGPIDRAERFQKDWQALPQLRGLAPDRLGPGAARVLVGMFKKFVLADTLALGMALTPDLAQQSHHPLALWGLLYGYAFRLYFDFAGYTDIAIGLGMILGIQLPENFRQPYFSTDITRFWQRWHITLSNWVRFYLFSPFTRSLLRRKPRPSPTLIVFLGLMATMIAIGLWHGVTWTFFIWGAWHGLGLFIHKQWADRTRAWHRRLNSHHPWRARAWTGVSWLLTFHFVVLGWVWFLSPDLQLALHIFRGLIQK